MNNTVDLLITGKACGETGTNFESRMVRQFFADSSNDTY